MNSLFFQIFTMNRWQVLLVFCGTIFAQSWAQGIAPLSDSALKKFQAFGVNITSQDTNHWMFKHSGVPSHAYGPFPSRHNPNDIQVKNHEFSIPKIPTPVSQPMCLPMGPIGVAISGIPFFNPYSDEGYDAVGGVDGTGQCAEVFDNCKGHPQATGMYHYHQLPTCLYNGTENELLGVAFDGHPIYGPLIENGVTVNRKSGVLDVCGGRYYNGEYRYHITYDFPYVLACYHSMVHTRHHFNRHRRHESQIQKRQQFPRPWQQHPFNPHQGCIRPTAGPRSWLPCFANCENPILGCHNQTSAIIG